MKNFKMLSRAEMRNVAGGNLCGPGEFACGDGTCIDERMMMDGFADCPDGSDEELGGRCVQCACHFGSTTCWYTKRTEYELCRDVCGSAYFSSLDLGQNCNGCNLN